MAAFNDSYVTHGRTGSPGHFRSMATGGLLASRQAMTITMKCPGAMTVSTSSAWSAFSSRLMKPVGSISVEHTFINREGSSMSDHHDAQDYTANGPSNVGFRTGGANIEVGVQATGHETGVHGVGVGHDGLTDFAVAGVRGESNAGYGVIGQATVSAFPGVQGNSESYVGVIGESRQDAGVEGHGLVGVVGRGDASLAPEDSEREDIGVGVYGTSEEGKGVFGKVGSGIGVHGVSSKGEGVVGESTIGVGVVGRSNQDRGGTFGSERQAQIRLLPRRQSTPPKTGKAGDLLVISVRTPDVYRDHSTLEAAQLWFCIRGSSSGHNAVWGKVDFSAIQQ
ncbi:MAG TPA: hypothetical protein VIN58_09975 [Roseateles sp.]